MPCAVTSTAIGTSFPRTLSMRPAGTSLVTLAVSTTAYGAAVHSRCIPSTSGTVNRSAMSCFT